MPSNETITEREARHARSGRILLLRGCNGRHVSQNITGKAWEQLRLLWSQDTNTLRNCSWRAPHLKAQACTLGTPHGRTALCSLQRLP